MKNKPQDATVEELIEDICYYEDPDTSLLVNFGYTDGFAITVCDIEGRNFSEGSTMKEALINFFVSSTIDLYKRLGYDLEEELDRYSLDWSDHV